MIRTLQNLWIKLLALLITAGVVMAGCSSASTFPQEIQVQAEESGDPVLGAVVRAEIGVKEKFEAVSDSRGVARLAIDQDYAERWAKIVVEADGFERKSILLVLTREGQAPIIQLEALDPETSTE